MDNPPFQFNTKNDDFSKFPSPLFKNLPKKSSLSSLFCFPTSVIALLVLLLLSYNSFTIFYLVPIFSMENDNEIDHKLPTSKTPSSKSNYAIRKSNKKTLSIISAHGAVEPSHNSTFVRKSKSRLVWTGVDFQTKVFYQKKTLPLISMTTHIIKSSHATPRKTKQVRISKAAPSLKPLTFAKRVRLFFNENSCKFRVFMTWISSIDSFGKREKSTIESLFKFNPNACLLIVSNSMESSDGTKILEPFLRLNFKVMAVSPDFKFIFKNTMADEWYTQLEKGDIRPGGISLGQNLSNLLRLALLFKYGGVYMDTDFIVLKRLDTLKNVIGAQTIDPYTKKWSRLNNALMVFDKKHPLLIKFIEEFALTFNGNKWGHNGPYLVSRVVERVNNGSIEGVGEFTILPPTAFYVVDWARIGNLFKKPMDEHHLKWINEKINQIVEECYAVHLWNRESREVEVENGSIIGHLMERSCIFCDFSSPIS